MSITEDFHDERNRIVTFSQENDRQANLDAFYNRLKFYGQGALKFLEEVAQKREYQAIDTLVEMCRVNSKDIAIVNTLCNVIEYEQGYMHHSDRAIDCLHNAIEALPDSHQQKFRNIHLKQAI